MRPEEEEIQLEPIEKNPPPVVPRIATGQKGYLYEQEILRNLRSARLSNVRVHRQTGARAQGDIEISYKGKRTKIEIKKDNRAQMGGTSVQFDIENNNFGLTDDKAVKNEHRSKIYSRIRSKVHDLKEYIQFVMNEEGTPLTMSIPFGRIRKTTWDAARNKGLLQRLNLVINLSNTDFIKNYYNNKGIYYIHIGKQGLFYMNKNPLDLPIPELKGVANVEIRLQNGGSQTGTVSSSYRIQGRLVNNNKSPLTLDKIQDIKKIFGEI